MPLVLNGTGTITGLQAGGLPDATVLTADIADANITAAKLSGAQSGSAPIYGCRAWCVFDGRTTGTNAPTAGGNVSTVQRLGAGSYQLTFATAMADANYCVVATGSTSTSSGTGGTNIYAMTSFSPFTNTVVAPTTTTVNIGMSSATDAAWVQVAIFR